MVHEKACAVSDYVAPYKATFTDLVTPPADLSVDFLLREKCRSVQGSNVLQRELGILSQLESFALPRVCALDVEIHPSSASAARTLFATENVSLATHIPKVW